MIPQPTGHLTHSGQPAATLGQLQLCRRGPGADPEPHRGAAGSLGQTPGPFGDGGEARWV